jgi:nitrate/TMAO reductase-like tetraheme cytochrome c subunit
MADKAEKKLPRLAYNWTTALGAVIAGSALAILLVLLAMILVAGEEVSPYFGIFLYVVLPAFLVLGLLLIPLGMARQWRRWRKTGDYPQMRWPRIDLNHPGHRNAALVLILGTVIVVTVGSVGTYEAYHYSESVTFCGTSCHEVMEPEYTTYQNSPHARVACAECHIGSGAGWFVKSKLSGAYQVYATAANVYPRPIPTPIESLRPAQETCEQCHWPERIYGAQQKTFHHFMYDDDNTAWPIDMLIKTGGGDPRSGQTAGIHWHMNIGVAVEYIARDDKRQEIPWVRITDRQTGRVTVYQDRSNPLSEEEVAAASPRVMDCMDCHNRPSHIFRSPDYAIDIALLAGDVDAGLPAIKRVAVEAMAEDYESVDEAHREIANRIAGFYRAEHPELFEQRRVAVDRAVAATQRAYALNVFPAMKAKWSAYTNNVGHFTDLGCMRCHDGEHVDDGGVAVSADCNACHVILSQGSGERRRIADTAEGLEFEHPEDIGEMWREVGCHECHAGVQP